MGVVCGRERVSWSGLRWVCTQPAHPELVQVNQRSDLTRFVGVAHVFVRDRREPQPQPVT